MELRVAAAENTVIPDGCYVSVGVGDVQRQAPYDPSKRYKFNEATEFVNIDVFRFLGSCSVRCNPDRGGTYTFNCGIGGDDVGTPGGITLSVDITLRPAKTVARNPKDQKDKTAKTSKVTRYLKEHAIEAILSDAMRELLKAMPQDPTKFLSERIANRGNVATVKAPKESSLKPPANLKKDECPEVETQESTRLPSSDAEESPRGHTLKTALSKWGLQPDLGVDPLIPKEVDQDLSCFRVANTLISAEPDGVFLTEFEISPDSVECETAPSAVIQQDLCNMRGRMATCLMSAQRNGILRATCEKLRAERDEIAVGRALPET
jgi:hypothetical protein